MKIIIEQNIFRLAVSSCCFPKFARNSNTGSDVASEVLADYRTATNPVYHDSTYPSQILLPIIESD